MIRGIDKIVYHIVWPRCSAGAIRVGSRTRRFRTHEEGPRRNGLAEADIAVLVANDKTPRRIETELRAGGVHEAGTRFAAIAPSIRMTGTVVNAVDTDALGLKQGLHAMVYRRQLRLVEIPAANTRLVRQNRQAQTETAQTRQSLGGTRQNLHPRRVGQIAAVRDHGPIPIQQRRPGV